MSEEPSTNAARALKVPVPPPSENRTTEKHPIPTTISAAAQAVLASSLTANVVPNPAPDDEEAWHAIGQAAASDDPDFTTTMAMVTTGAVPAEIDATVEALEVAGAKYFVATPEGHVDDDVRVLLYIHGGGFIFGGGPTARRSTQLLAGNYRVKTWGLDYRQLPDHLYPAGLDDAMAVYRELLLHYRPETIALGAQSGGSTIALALLQKARDEGLPMPVAVALISPPADFTQAGDSYQTNAFSMAPGGVTNMVERLRGKASLTDPFLSPLFGDFAGFPPTLLSCGTRDFLLSDTVRVHRKLLRSGVRAELHVWEGAPHGMFMGRAPEDVEQVEQIRSFLENAWATAEASS